MTSLPRSYELLVEEGGIITLPEAVIRHLGYEPDVAVQLNYDIRPDGSIVILSASSSAELKDGA